MTCQEAINWIKSHRCITENTLASNSARMSIDALEKQIPKKPIRYVTLFPSCCIVSKCPNCGQEFGFNTEFNFCENCGQRLDFRGESIYNEDE